MCSARGRRARLAQHPRRARPDGILVDTQPVSASPPVGSNGGELGTLDMRDWLDTIQEVHELVAQAIAGGLYEVQHQSWLRGPGSVGHRRGRPGTRWQW